MSPIEFILSNWMMVLIGAVVLFLVAAIILEYDSQKTASDVGRDVGDRSKRAIGGAAGATAGLTVGVLGGLYEAGMSFADVFDLLGDWFLASPEGFVGLFIAFLGTFLSGPRFLGLALILLAIGILAARRRRRSSVGGR
jgi:hypothetical protein